MRNNIFNWMKLSSFIFALSILFVSCNQDEMFEPDAQETTALRVVVGDFPAFGGNAQTRASNIGVPDAGKTHWVENDEIIISVKSEKYGTQYATLTYNGEEWCFDDYLKYLEGENEEDGTLEVTALYAPCYEVLDDAISLKEGKTEGMDEYLEVKCHIENRGVLQIPFSQAKRNYSRIRIACASEVKSIFIAAGRFTPAGIEKEYSEVFYNETPFSVDENGNAYIYGSFGKNDQNQYGWIYVEDWDIEHIPLIDYYYFTKATEPGKSYALYAGKKVDVDLSTLAATYVINDDANYTFTGTGSYGIKVESGNPRIILNNVNITVGEEYDFENVVNAIDIVADNSETTVWITGTNNLTSNSGAGIYVKSGSTVIIKSDSRDNILTARAGMDGAGIGGTGYDFSYENVTCGNIYIENITVNAYSSGYMSSNPGIGAITSCGTITIKNATVTALGSNQGGVLYGGEFCPAIGASTVPDIVIENSTINAYRGDSKDGGTGSLADWIGAVIIYDPYSGDTPHTPGIQCGNGYIISTTVNKFLYKASSGVTKEEGSVTYDADGNPTEQTAE